MLQACECRVFELEMLVLATHYAGIVSDGTTRQRSSLKTSLRLSSRRLYSKLMLFFCSGGVLAVSLEGLFFVILVGGGEEMDIHYVHSRSVLVQHRVARSCILSIPKQALLFWQVKPVVTGMVAAATTLLPLTRHSQIYTPPSARVSVTSDVDDSSLSLQTSHVDLGVAADDAGSVRGEAFR